MFQVDILNLVVESRDENVLFRNSLFLGTLYANIATNFALECA